MKNCPRRRRQVALICLVSVLAAGLTQLPATARSASGADDAQNAGPSGYANTQYLLDCMGRAHGETQMVVDFCFWNFMLFVSTMHAETCLAIPSCTARVLPEFAVARNDGFTAQSASYGLGSAIERYMKLLERFINMCAEGKMPKKSEYDSQEDLYISTWIFACAAALVMFGGPFALGAAVLALIKPKPFRMVADGQMPNGTILLQDALDGLAARAAQDYPWAAACAVPAFDASGDMYVAVGC